MRNPNERLDEIRRRADARIAAAKERKRALTTLGITAAMCIVIGIGMYNRLSLPISPPVEPTVSTTTSSTEEQQTSATTFTTEDVTDTSHLPLTTIIPMNTTVASNTTQESFSETSATASSSSATVTTRSSSVSHTTVTTRTTKATNTTRSTSESTSKSTVTTTTRRSVFISHSITTTTTFYTTTTTRNVDYSPITTTTHTTTTTNPPPQGGGEIMSPTPTDPSTTTVSYTTTTTAAYTTTTTAQSYVIFSISSVYEVSVGDIITVDVAVSDDHYLVDAYLWFSYNADELELLKVGNNPYSPYVDHINTDVLPDDSLWDFGVPGSGALVFTFASAASSGPTQGGTMFSLTFRVLDGFDQRSYINLHVQNLVSSKTDSNGVTTKYTPSVLKYSGFISADKKRN